MYPRTSQEELKLARDKYPDLQATVEVEGWVVRYKYRRPVACPHCHQPKAGPRVYHPNDKHDEEHRPAIAGGTTVCKLTNGDGSVVGEGLARCLPDENFAYDVGRTYALERAICDAWNIDPWEDDIPF